MLKYGGKYENYFSRYRVTHIICSNLPNSKLKNLRFVYFFFEACILGDCYMPLKIWILLVTPLQVIQRRSSRGDTHLDFRFGCCK